MKSHPYDKNIIISKKEKNKELDKIADCVDYLRTYPKLRTLFIEMTLNCNEHCRHCGSRCGDLELKDQLEDQEIKDFLLKLKSQVDRLPFLDITGGEPLLRKSLCDIMTYASSLGYHWGMTTNGLLIDKKMAHELKKAGMYSISISIDGLEETHDWFRQVPGAYKKSMKAVKNLVEEGFGKVMITTVVHKKNIGELEELYKVVKATGVDIWRVINVDPIGRALEDEDIRLDTVDYKYIIDFIQEKRANDTEMEVAYGCNHFLGPKREKELRDWYFMCTAGIQTAGIFYNGDIGACLDIERIPANVQGNIRKDDFYDVWLNKFKVFRRDKAANSEKCANCKYRKHCQGGGYHTWDAEKKEPRICMVEMLKKAKKEEKVLLKNRLVEMNKAIDDLKVKKVAAEKANKTDVAKEITLNLEQLIECRALIEKVLNKNKKTKKAKKSKKK